MNKLKVFVGVDGKWVLCEKFPKDEVHDGLHEALEELVSENIEVEESPGFYLMSFTTDSGGEGSCSDFSFNDRFCLYIDELEVIKNK